MAILILRLSSQLSDLQRPHSDSQSLMIKLVKMQYAGAELQRISQHRTMQTLTRRGLYCVKVLKNASNSF